LNEVWSLKPSIKSSRFLNSQSGNALKIIECSPFVFSHTFDLFWSVFESYYALILFLTKFLCLTLTSRLGVQGWDCDTNNVIHVIHKFNFRNINYKIDFSNTYHFIIFFIYWRKIGSQNSMVFLLCFIIYKMTIKYLIIFLRFNKIKVVTTRKVYLSFSS